MESLKSTYPITPRSALQARLQDVYVGQIAATSMAASVLFFMMQMLIPIPFAIITLVALQMGWVDPKATETVARVTVGLIEVAAIVFLIHFVRRRVPKHPSLLTESEITQAIEDGGTMAFTERQLEIGIAVMACVPLWYLFSCLLHFFGNIPVPP